MGMFGRDLIPISSAALQEIDAQAARTLRANLSARRFVDVKGPFGWSHSCVPAGRLGSLQKDGGVGYGVRTGLPLLESRIDFELDIMELHNVDRGAADPDLVPVERAARSAAAFEDKVIYEGLKKAGLKGMKESAEGAPLALPKADPEAFVRAVRDAVYKMKTEDSIDGPFVLVGGRDLSDVLGRLVNGRTLYEVLEKNTDVGEYVYTPSYAGAFLVSGRGGDFELTLGGDFTVGYTGREKDTLKFYLTESFAFRILEPRAYAIIHLA